MLQNQKSTKTNKNKLSMLAARVKKLDLRKDRSGLVAASKQLERAPENLIHLAQVHESSLFGSEKPSSPKCLTICSVLTSNLYHFHTTTKRHPGLLAHQRAKVVASLRDRDASQAQSSLIP